MASAIFADPTTAVRAACDSYYQSWVRRDFEAMHAATQKTWAAKDGNTPKLLEQWHPFDLSHYELGTTEKAGDCLWKVQVSINAGGIDRKCVATVICETAPYNPDLRGDWGINPISTLRRF